MAKVLLKKSSVGSNVPTVGDLVYGELAINFADGRLYYKNSSNAIKSFIDSAGVESLISNIDHDGLNGFVANEHVDHSTVDITAGAGLTGGGDITATRTLNIGAGTGVTVSADAISIGQDVSTTSNVTFAKVTSDSSSVDNISFRIRATAPNDAAGTLYFDSDEQQSLSLKLRTLENPTPGVTLNVGQENLIYVHNLSGAQIDNGKAVYISGTAHGKHPQVSLSKADTSSTGRIAGLATMDIPNGGHGWVTSSGMVRGLDTSVFTAGDVLYLSKDSAGELTNVGVTVDTGYPVHAARVMTVDSSEGMVLVEPFSEHFEYLRVEDRLRVDGKITGDSAVVSELATAIADFTPTDPGPAHKEGRVYYNDEYKALTVYNDISDISLQVGLEEWTRVYNNTGSTILNGTPVYPTGAIGETLTVAPADATTESKARVLGVATHDIADASEGIATTRGLVSGINTSHLIAGGPIHLAADGTIQGNAPTYPYFATDLGECVEADSSNGYLYINIQHHSFEQFRVTGNTHLDGNLTVDGDLTVNGTQSVVSQANLAVDNSFIYLNSGDTIGSGNTNFTGSGLDDAYFTGHYEGTTTKTFYVRIDGVGTGTGGVDTFEWSLDNFSTTQATGVDITGSDQSLADGISVFFNATTGHTSNDKWDGQAAPTDVDTGWFTNRNTGETGVGYTHLGIYFDVSDNTFKVVDEYAPEPNGSIDDGDSSYSLGVLKAQTFEGNLTGNVTGTVTGNASSATVLNTSRNIGISGDITASGVAFNGSSDITLSAAITAGSIVNADISATAAITDSKLATISTVGKVQNSATTATSANTGSAIVARDVSGNFTANIVTASLSGNASTATTLNTSRNFSASGDATASAVGFNGSSNVDLALTLATVNSNVGTFGSATTIPVITVDGKGRLTAVSTATVAGVTGVAYDSSDGALTVNTSGGDFSANITLGPFSTTDLAEGTNQYYTAARADSAIDTRVTKSFVDNLNVDADTLDGEDGSYYRIDVYDASGTLLN